MVPLSAPSAPGDRHKGQTHDRAGHPGYVTSLVVLGADDGIRTRDPHLGKVVLYH